MSVTQRTNGILAVAAALCLTVAAQEAPAPAAAASEGDAFFVQQVLPVLRANCFKCHGPLLPRVKGGLRMNSSASLLHGGASGPAIVPGDAESSLLVKAIRWTDPELQMPPKTQLPDESRLVLEQWIVQGAHWPDGFVATPGVAPGAGAQGGAGADGGGDRNAAGGTADGNAGNDAPPAGEPPVLAVPALSDHDAAMFFEQEVRPVLADNCFKCHGPDLPRVKSGLRMSGRDALLKGGERGPAIVPGDPDQSRLIQAVRYLDADFAMPPKTRLPDHSIAALERWVALGAPWPTSAADDSGAAGGADGAPTRAEPGGSDDDAEPPIDFEQGRTWWSFRPVQRPPIPASPALQEGGDFVANPIDAFVLARLAAAGLHPNPPASRAELVRRAWFDLVGLPPSAEEVQRFVHDAAPDAWEQLIDRLLAMPQYGERWGRHWLDVVRFAQTNGYEKDEEKPAAWRYRDYVIDAFNADKPYDRFVLEQLAGDELDTVTNEALIATGLYRVGVWDSEPDDVEQATFDDLDDVVRTIGEGFMGVTIGCARCHDHKFDPFGQDDYYSTLAFVRNVRRYATPQYAVDSAALTPLGLTRAAFVDWDEDRKRYVQELEAEARKLLEIGRDRYIQKHLSELPADVRAAWDTPIGQRTRAQAVLLAKAKTLHPDKGEIDASLEKSQSLRLFELGDTIEKTRTSFAGDLEWALTVREAGAEAPPTHVLVRGKASAPAAEVPPRFVRVLCPSDAEAEPVIRPPARRPTTGRRRALAEWIASAEHPLAARVLVNRVWHHHFGRGIVSTLNDFGKTGSLPTHPELLDWLASEFVSEGWSVKRLHRLILTSSTWRMSSRAEDPAALAADPDNALLWRQNLRRLDAEALRDAVLSAAGNLDLEAGGRGFFPRLSREALAGGSRPGEGWDVSSPQQQGRRSVYAYVKRSLLVPLLEIFDYTSTALPVAERPVTTIASQALMLLNGEFMNEQAALFAARVAGQAGDDLPQQVRAAFRHALSREPTEQELAIATDALDRQARAFAETAPLFTFRARLPSRVDQFFLAKLSGEDALFGPRAGWRALRGSWGEGYNNTKMVDPLRGPAALLGGPALGDVTVSARMRLHAGCEFGSLCLRAGEQDEVLTGLELRLEPAAGSSSGKARLLLHGETTTTLAEAAADVAPDVWHTVAIEAAGPRVQVWLDRTAGAAALIDVTDARIPADGALGVRTWGEALQLDELQTASQDTVVRYAPDDPGPPARRALESLCLTLLNLNEFITVD